MHRPSLFSYELIHTPFPRSLPVFPSFPLLLSLPLTFSPCVPSPNPSLVLALSSFPRQHDYANTHTLLQPNDLIWRGRGAVGGAERGRKGEGGYQLLRATKLYRYKQRHSGRCVSRTRRRGMYLADTSCTNCGGQHKVREEAKTRCT